MSNATMSAATMNARRKTTVAALSTAARAGFEIAAPSTPPRPGSARSTSQRAENDNREKDERKRKEHVADAEEPRNPFVQCGSGRPADTETRKYEKSRDGNEKYGRDTPQSLIAYSRLPPVAVVAVFCFAFASAALFFHSAIIHYSTHHVLERAGARYFRLAT